MEGSSNIHDDEEPQICTVFSSTSSTQSKTIFDTISFSIPKKENSVLSPSSPFSEDDGEVASSAKAFSTEARQGSASSSTAELNSFVQTPSHSQAPIVPAAVETSTETESGSSTMFESLSMSYVATGPTSGGFGESLQVTGSHELLMEKAESLSTTPTPSVDSASGTIVESGQGLDEGTHLIPGLLESLSIASEHPTNENATGENEQDSPLPTANSLFADAPEVPFPIGNFGVASGSTVPMENVFGLQQTSSTLNPLDTFSAGSSVTYSTIDAAYDAWIPEDTTRQVLMNIATAVHAGTYLPDKSHMTTPGIIYKEDLLDKVAVNMSRIFGEVEASKRQILTADSVTQDDNGIRELIKLGCYRSAINLTKRLLTLYGQGPGKNGQFSKHTPQSLQLWMTRIALLVRIREFKIAESELEAFNNFENPDMYYEYYQDSFGQGRKGSMIPFYFRLLAAEIPQYASKEYNESLTKLTKILQTIQQIIKNVNDGISEDGNSVTLDKERRNATLSIWGKREIRVLYSLTNAFLLAKDFSNAVKHLFILREKQIDKKAQLTSAIGRLFLQYGDLTTSQKYFKEAASMRSTDVESERVENLVDAALYFIAQGVYADAFGLLKEALVIQPDNFMITNNLAVCLLYMGKVKESLALMETTVRNNTPQLLQENVILNLSTIYELENSDGFKKNSLLKLISEYKGDGINLASLKMPNLI